MVGRLWIGLGIKRYVCRPSFYGWPVLMKKLMEKYHPKSDYCQEIKINTEKEFAAFSLSFLYERIYQSLFWMQLARSETNSKFICKEKNLLKEFLNLTFQSFLFENYFCLTYTIQEMENVMSIVTTILINLA